MVRILHTADWQLGLTLRFIPGDDGARARTERFRCVERIGELAQSREVDAVVVAGDVFDDNAVGRSTLSQARDALRHFGDVPVLLLPGNHDAATPDCALDRLEAPDNVHVLTNREPVELAGAVFWPCPLGQRHEPDDPTRHLPQRDGSDDRPWIALAHGGLVDFTEEGQSPNQIDFERVLDLGYDYLALGDWHGTLSFGPRVYYAGAPEPTNFKQNNPGNVLLVDLAGRRAEPRVEEVPVARTRWLDRTQHFQEDHDVDALASRIAELPERTMTLLQLRLEGELSLAARARLEELLEQQAEELLFLRYDDRELHDRPSEADLEALEREGFVGEAVQQLRQGEDPYDADALRLLHRFVQREEAEG